MPRKPNVSKYKTTDIIKNACQQLYKYEQHIFWNYEFGVRAFYLNEDKFKFKQCLYDLMTNIHKDNHELPPPSFDINTTKEYGKYIRSTIDCYILQLKNINLSELLAQNTTISTLAYVSLKYGLYPHQAFGLKNFHKRIGEAIKIEGKEKILLNFSGKAAEPQKDNFNLSRIQQLDEVPCDEQTENIRKNFYLYNDCSVIHRYSKSSRDYLKNILASYENNLSFFSAKMPSRRAFENQPVELKFFSPENINNIPEVDGKKYFYIFPKDTDAEKDIIEIIDRIFECFQCNLSNQDFSKKSINSIHSQFIIQVAINEKSSRITFNKFKAHLNSSLYMFYNDNIYKDPISIDYLYIIMPFIINNEKINDCEINKFLTSNLKIKDFNTFNKKIKNECCYINNISKVISKYSSQITLFSNSLGLFIYDMHILHGMKLTNLYNSLRSSKNISPQNIIKFTNINEIKDINVMTEFANNIAMQINYVREILKKKQDILYNQKSLTRTYEQVRKHINQHTQHPIYKE